MGADDKREIVQLWWIAEQYFAMGQQFKRYLTDQDLQTTVQQLADKCKHTSDIKGTNALLMLLNAHLGSCAVRLYSIDEKQSSCRYKLYQCIASKKNLKDNDVRNDLKCITHFLLRHNVCHEEKYKKGCQFKTMRKVLNSLSVKELYENMRLVKDEMEQKLKNKSII